MIHSSRNTHTPHRLAPLSPLWVFAAWVDPIVGEKGLAPLYCLLPHPTLTNKSPQKSLQWKKWVSMTPTLTMFSKNEDNKHKSWLSKQELSAFNAKKKTKQNKKLKSEGKYCWFCTWAGRRTWNLSVKLWEEPKGGWLFSTCPWQRPDLWIVAEAVGVFLFGVYIQTHPRLMEFYTDIYTHRGRLLFLCGNCQLHLGKLDANLSPTVIARRRWQSGLLRGWGHSTPL